jgi:hypothetical protein
MILFSDRLKLVKKYQVWRYKIIEEKKIFASDSYENFISFLQINNLLNEEKTKQFLNEK